MNAAPPGDTREKPRELEPEGQHTGKLSVELSRDRATV